MEDNIQNIKEEYKNDGNLRQRVYISFLLVCIALVAITAATVAWFSIADKTRVQTMGLDIITDVELKMDLDPHDTIDDYVKTLTFDDIAERMQKDKGYSMKETPLEPVTTSDYNIFTYEDGTKVEENSGSYLSFTLNFMAERDMIVHLTSADSSSNADDGTAVSSKVPSLPKAMRISFETDDTVWVYNPGGTDSLNKSHGGSVRAFGLPAADSMKLSDTNSLFLLKKGVNKAVQVHVWLEGTDPACTDDLQAADYSIKLRFAGTDMSGQPFSQ